MQYQLLVNLIKTGLVRTTSLLTILISLAACSQGVRVVEMPPPVGENTSLSRLTTDAKGKVYLSWVETKTDISSLYYATLAENEWSAEKLIGQGADWFVNWADFPFLSVSDVGMTAHWLAKSSEGTYDYDVKATFYDQDSKSWGEEITIHKDGVSAEHGFVSMLPMSEGRTFISWLDGRHVGKPNAEAEAAGVNIVGGMTLRAGFFDRHGETLNEWELDGLTCDCCQTSAAMTLSGPVVVYRDRSVTEIRDIYITRAVGGSWTKPVAVYADNWEIAGCPVNGPSVAAKDNMTAVVWFSAEDDKPKVSLAISQDSGEFFGKPITVATDSSFGRVSIAILDSGDIAVSWLQTIDSQAQIRLALYNSRGKLTDSVKVAATKASRRSGFPVIVSQGNDVFVSWTDLTDGQRVKVARVRF
jgi:hypothetical protein